MPRQPTPRIPDPRKAPTLRKGLVRRSKRVSDREKATARLIGHINSRKAAAAAGFAEKFAGLLRPGEAAPDETLSLELAGRAVKAALDLLIAADTRYCAKALDRRILNDACLHVAAVETYPELRDVRREIESRYGREAGRKIHRMKGHTCRKPKRQLPQLEKLVEMLRDWPRWARPLRPGPEGEREGWLERLEACFRKLTTMLEELEVLEIHEARLRDDRDYELEVFDLEYYEAVDYVRAVFRNGGLGEKVTWEILPTVQRRRLRGKARREAEARAEGRRAGKGEAPPASRDGPA